MSILELSIQAAGGVSALARALDLEPNVISMWRRRGIPDSWGRVLLLMQRHRDGVFSGSDITNVTSHDLNIVAETQSCT